MVVNRKQIDMIFQFRLMARMKNISRTLLKPPLSYLSTFNHNHTTTKLTNNEFTSVFTKSVKSNFRSFWLAPITWNILGYSLFCDWSQDGILFQDILERRNLSNKWSSCTNKYQESNKLWLVGCLLVIIGRKLMSCWICNKKLKMHLTKSTNVFKL